MLKGYILFSLLLPEWPLKDFGHFIDHFGTYSGHWNGEREETYMRDDRGSIGINNVTFKTIAKSLFNISDFEPSIRVWWLPNWERFNLNETRIIEHEQKSIHVYPLPGWLAHLFVPGNVTENEYKSKIAHPAFIENLTGIQLFKMLKFGLWAKSKSMVAGEKSTLSDILRKELAIFEDHGYDIRNEFQVGITK